MKKIVLTLIVLLTIVLKIDAQDIVGKWNGILEVQGTQLPLVFNISKADAGYSGTFDSPTQGAKDIKLNSTTYENGVLTLKYDQLKIEYTGTLNKDNIIEGTFKQGGYSAPLNLSKKEVEIKKANRPQEPKPPYSYYTEDVTFKNEKAGVTLAGTLSLPAKDGKYPIVVLVSGSGPQNRNEELLGHKPFLVIADYLTKNGIGVLRYDDRGVAKSTGVFKTATSFDFADDATAAVNYLKTRVEAGKIGIAGHSEGGVIAPIVAAKNKNVNFIILLAGTGVVGDKLLLEQTYLISKADGASAADLVKAKKTNEQIFSLIKKATSEEQAKKELTILLKKEIKNMTEADKPKDISEDDFIKQQVAQMANPWMMNFLRYDPAINLKKVKCPVLALNGDKDLQVPSAMNLPAIKKAVMSNGNKNVTTKEFKNLNHLFQETTTGSPTEYSIIEQTISPLVLEEMLNWIKGLK
jgi:uncharacterized protein